MHWFFDPNLSLSSSELPEAEAAHASKSLRVVVGERISVTNGRGLAIEAEVTQIEKSRVQFEIQSHSNRPQDRTQITLVQALAKGDRDELALQSCIEVGLYSAQPWQSERSVVRWNNEKIQKGLDRWQQIAVEAMKQSQQSHLCKVEAMFDQNTPLDGRTLVLDPTADVSLTDLDLMDSKRINLLVGPEGGISTTEMKNFEQLGYERVRLGSSVMRTSTAGLAALCTIRTLLGTWEQA